MRVVQILIASLLFSITTEAFAQQPAFEAATVKRRLEPGGGFVGRQPGGRFTAQGATLQDIIVFAYRLQSYQIVGGPAWLNKDRWDISANGGPTSPEDELVALQRLLADRFSLTIHRETQQLPVFTLVLARSDGRLGPQLVRSPVDCAAMRAEAAKTGVIPPDARRLCNVQGRIGSIRMGGSPLSEFIQILAERLQRTVVDRTGLAGPWDLTLTYTPEPSQIAPGALAPGDQPTIDPNGPSIFTAVQEQLGLKLEATRAPVEVLVIDRAEIAKEN
jgi:bla regulator protein blaR1